MMAAEMITRDAVYFMATHGRGLICLVMAGERHNELKLATMAPDNTALGDTGFTVSIDAKGRGVTTGISAHDRSQAICAVIDARSGPEYFARPGHVFPLRSRANGLLGREGHTEAAVDLAGVSALHPSGVICKILNDEGTMARVSDLEGLVPAFAIPKGDLRLYFQGSVSLEPHSQISQ
jgi:3,4-dihydroxy 2-butanone 4-phosphate synthase / GTP cyclohydrolase II